MGTLTLVLLLAGMAWEKEPDGYRGLAWGAQVTEAPFLAEITGCWCEPGGMCQPTVRPGGTAPESRTCFSSVQVGPVPIKDTLLFHGDALEAAVWSFDSRIYEPLRDIYLEKYGPPTTRETKAVQNRMGATFEDETLTWTGARVTVTISRYAGTLTKGAASLMTNERLAREVAARQAVQAKAKDSF